MFADEGSKIYPRESLLSAKIPAYRQAGASYYLSFFGHTTTADFYKSPDM